MDLEELSWFFSETKRLQVMCVQSFARERCVWCQNLNSCFPCPSSEIGDHRPCLSTLQEEHPDCKIRLCEKRRQDNNHVPVPPSHLIMSGETESAAKHCHRDMMVMFEGIFASMQPVVRHRVLPCAKFSSFGILSTLKHMHVVVMLGTLRTHMIDF